MSDARAYLLPITRLEGPRAKRGSHRIRSSSSRRGTRYRNWSSNPEVNVVFASFQVPSDRCRPSGTRSNWQCIITNQTNPASTSISTPNQKTKEAKKGTKRGKKGKTNHGCAAAQPPLRTVEGDGQSPHSLTHRVNILITSNTFTSRMPISIGKYVLRATAQLRGISTIFVALPTGAASRRLSAISQLAGGRTRYIYLPPATRHRVLLLGHGKCFQRRCTAGP